MINITNKKDCCGCSACVQRCPKQCISLHEDNEGFLYPHVNTNDCINCGLCEKVCPWLNRQNKLQPLEVLAVKNRNEEERMASSSGGVFIALAKKVIADGGVVFGAVFDEKWEVKHTYAEKIEDVKPMMGSKYLQSRIENSYKDAEKFLKDGRLVLFTGSPCQITGLHNYLRKNYSNLISADFLCHGVPSPGVWRKYLNEAFDRSEISPTSEKIAVSYSSTSLTYKIKNIEFRNKTFRGWKNFSLVINGTLSESGENSLLLSESFHQNPYMQGFLSDIYLRPSCYKCKCKNGISHSDITIGDFWGAPKTMPDFDDNKGIGLVLVNTNKGKVIFDSLDMDVRKTTIKNARISNGGFNDNTAEHPNRKIFFSMYQNSIDLISNINNTLKISLFKRVITKVKRLIHKIIRKLIKK